MEVIERVKLCLQIYREEIKIQEDPIYQDGYLRALQGILGAYGAGINDEINALHEEIDTLKANIN